MGSQYNFNDDCNDGSVSSPAVINVKSNCSESKKKNIISKLSDAPNGKSKAWLDSMVWPNRKIKITLILQKTKGLDDFENPENQYLYYNQTELC